jgi:membrane-associated HD superfamily phosphohydrolase
MEQTIQQISQKPLVPIKTKIAAWLMLIMGILGVGYTLMFFFLKSVSSSYHATTLTIIKKLLYFFIFLFLPGLFLLKRKKWAWWLALFSSILSFFIFPYGLIIFGFVIGEIFPLIIMIFIFIIVILILDRKNFFKIAS